MSDPSSNDRVTLRPIGLEDRDEIAAYINEVGMRGLRQMERDPIAPLSAKAIDDAVAEWSDQKKAMSFVISPSGEDEVVGHAVADWRWEADSPFVGVAIAPRYRRRGYGSAALDMALAVLFGQTVAHTVQAWTPS